MKENGKNQSERISLPPAWCGSICRNAMSEACVEHCAVKRDCSAFLIKPNLKLTDMPRFPQTDGMTKEERFTSVSVYLAKVVDHLTGNDNELVTPVIVRSLHQAIARNEAVSSVQSVVAEKKEEQ